MNERQHGIRARLFGLFLDCWLATHFRPGSIRLLFYPTVLALSSSSFVFCFCVLSCLGGAESEAVVAADSAAVGGLRREAGARRLVPTGGPQGAAPGEEQGRRGGAEGGCTVGWYWWGLHARELWSLLACGEPRACVRRGGGGGGILLVVVVVLAAGKATKKKPARCFVFVSLRARPKLRAPSICVCRRRRSTTAVKHAAALAPVGGVRSTILLCQNPARPSFRYF